MDGSEGAKNKTDLEKKAGLLTRFFSMALLMLFPLAGWMMVRGNVHTIAEGCAMRAWTPAPARIVDVTLLYVPEQTEHEGTVMRHRIQARYGYTFGGSEYQGTRVALIDAPGYLDFPEQVYQGLEQARKTGATVTCFVNPAHPEQAVLNRVIDWGYFNGAAILGLFLLLGGLCMVAALIFQMVKRVGGRVGRGMGGGRRDGQRRQSA